MAISIRSAELSDEERVIALWRDCGLVVSYNDPVADFRFAKAGPSSDVLLAEDAEDQLVGAVMVGHDGHRGWVYYVGAHPTMRGQGVGRQVMVAAEAWLRARGVIKMQLMVRDTNTQVLAFYERLGFEVAPRVLMGKWLRD